MTKYHGALFQLQLILVADSVISPQTKGYSHNKQVSKVVQPRLFNFPRAKKIANNRIKVNFLDLIRPFTLECLLPKFYKTKLPPSSCFDFTSVYYEIVVLLAYPKVKLICKKRVFLGQSRKSHRDKSISNRPQQIKRRKNRQRRCKSA